MAPLEYLEVILITPSSTYNLSEGYNRITFQFNVDKDCLELSAEKCTYEGVRRGVDRKTMPRHTAEGREKEGERERMRLRYATFFPLTQYLGMISV